MQTHDFPATKFVFNLGTKNFDPVLTNIRINTSVIRPFGIGGMRLCFKVDEVDERGRSSSMLAKVFKRDIQNITQEDYFNEAMAQCMCEEFATNFNANANTPKKVSFVVCFVIRISQGQFRNINATPGSLLTFRPTDSNDLYFVMEPLIDGAFVKYNSNFGEVYEKSNVENATRSFNARHVEMLQTAEAFSHFTLEESGGGMLVCDLQGVGERFTDPQIHTEQGRGLGMGNMGAEGINKWAAKHQCNRICNLVGLPLLRKNGARDAPPRRQNPYQDLRQQMADSFKRASVPNQQDISPLLKKPNESTADYAARCRAMSEEDQVRLAVHNSRFS